jgi:tetratricopeptide (TPR) repeat protein
MTRMSSRRLLIVLACSVLGFGSSGLSALSPQSRPPLSESMPAPNTSVSSARLSQDQQLIAAGKYSLAEDDLRKLLQADRASAEAHFLLGYVLYREQRPKQSLAEYTAGARIQKPGANDLAAVAMDYILLQDYADADKWLTLAVTWDPGNFLYIYYLGRTKYNEGRNHEAVSIFKKALTIHPGSIRAEYNLGLSYAALNQEDKAISAYKTAIAWESATGHHDPQPYFDLGHILLDRGEYQQARDNLEKAVAMDPSNPRFHQFLGEAYEFLGQLQPAGVQLKDAVDLSPNVSALHFQLGRIYQKQGLTAEARKEFARCSALQGTHSTDMSQTPNPIAKK